MFSIIKALHRREIVGIPGFFRGFFSTCLGFRVFSTPERIQYCTGTEGFPHFIWYWETVYLGACHTGNRGGDHCTTVSIPIPCLSRDTSSIEIGILSERVQDSRPPWLHGTTLSESIRHRSVYSMAQLPSSNPLFDPVPVASLTGRLTHVPHLHTWGIP